ncbi:MAG: N-acetylmuramoyl-L-alanine amidase [Oscillochloridaceae bacterium umkhey_bin13]
MTKPRSRRLATTALVLLVSLLLAACTSAQAAEPPLPTTVAPPAPTATAIQVAELARQAQADTTPVAPTPRPPTATPLPPTATAPAPEPTADPAAAPTALPAPTARPADAAPRVGLQVGHLRSNELPDELAHLRSSTGARWGNLSEAQLNQAIVNRIRPLLEAEGIIVDVLPATVPPGYVADAFLSIHADGSTSPGPRGWKLATPWRASEASKQLLASVAATYGRATGLSEDVGGITVNMKGYYAFNWRRHTHAIDRYTPAIIVETGFMTNAADRAVIIDQPDRVARGIAEGVLNYLRQRDPNDTAALIPPDFTVHRAITTGVAVRAAPRENARLLVRVGPEARISPFERQGDWLQAFVRVGDQRVIGWVRADMVTATNEQPTFPTAATNP